MCFSLSKSSSICGLMHTLAAFADSSQLIYSTTTSVYESTREFGEILTVSFTVFPTSLKLVTSIDSVN